MTEGSGPSRFSESFRGIAGAAAANAFSCVEIASAAPIAGADGGQARRSACWSIPVTISSSAPSRPTASSIAPAGARRRFPQDAAQSMGPVAVAGIAGAAAEQRTLMLDYGYTPEVLLNNMELIGVDPVQARRADRQPRPLRSFRRPASASSTNIRDKLPADIKLYAGGEDNFCHRVSPTPTKGQFADFGTLDRRELAAQKVTTVLCETPTVIAGHAFTTGKIKRTQQRAHPAATPGSNSASRTGSAAMPATTLPAEMAGQDRPRRAHPRARDLLQRQG